MPITQINNLMQGAKLDNLIGEAKPLTLNNKEEKKNFEDVIIDTIDKVIFRTRCSRCCRYISRARV